MGLVLIKITHIFSLVSHALNVENLKNESLICLLQKRSHSRGMLNGGLLKIAIVVPLLVHLTFLLLSFFLERRFSIKIAPFLIYS